MKNNLKYIIAVGAAIVALSASCKKDWLDAKPNKSLVVPQSVQDYQALLDNTSVMNSNQPGLGEVSADNFYLPYTTWQSLQTIERNSYIWAKDLYQGSINVDWNDPYTNLLDANIALEGIEKVVPDGTTQAGWNNVKGSALFYRALDFYNLAQLFCRPYVQTTAATDLGIPLRLGTDINVKSVRASVQETYSQIINDLLNAKSLLPVIPLYKTRPSKPAVYALLARTYLTMENYGQAKLYADSCLQLYPDLIDYNSLNARATRPIPTFNSEVIFHTAMLSFVGSKNALIDTVLYQSYQTNDLRKSIFFNAAGRFKGNYTGNSYPFAGLATDEIYLIRAEAEARAGNTNDAMADLNTVLIKRWVTGTFMPLTATNTDVALVTILEERQKELLFRGLRWTDLRRLNMDPRFAKTLTRLLNGQVYTLPANDIRYVFPIPDNEISLSGMQQNPR
jgi:tetratricopeptide (TPR) repeat protein